MRKYIYHEIVDFYKKEAEAAKGSGGQTLQNTAVNQQGKIKVPTPPVRRSSDISVRKGPG